MGMVRCPVAVNAARLPDGIAISWGRRNITWDMFNNYVHSTSRYLKEIAVRAGQTVVVLKDDSPSATIVMLALWRIGAAVCYMDPNSNAGEPSAVAALIKPDLVIGLRSGRKAWPRERRWADIEQVVTYGYNDFFMGCEAALSPELDEDKAVLVRLCCCAPAGLTADRVTLAQWNADPGELAGLSRSFVSGDTFNLT